MIRLRRGKVPLRAVAVGWYSLITAPRPRDDLVTQPFVGARSGRVVAAADDADGDSVAGQRRGVGGTVDANREAGDDDGAALDQASGDTARPVPDRRQLARACPRQPQP